MKNIPAQIITLLAGICVLLAGCNKTDDRYVRNAADAGSVPR